MMPSTSGKDYIMSLYMESLKRYRSHWQQLMTYHSGYAERYNHLRCLEERLHKFCGDNCETSKPNMEDDLSHLVGPVTDRSICRVLKRRFLEEDYYTFSGNILIAINPQTSKALAKALSPDRSPSDSLRSLANSVLHETLEQRLSQTILLNGECGSGKTRVYQQVIRHLYSQHKDGLESENFKQLSAALTALRPFDTVSTAVNNESTQSIWCLKFAAGRDSLQAEKLSLCSLSTTRLVCRPLSEKPYTVFYMIMAGMSKEEKEFYHLARQTEATLVYLQTSKRKILDVAKYSAKYKSWKESLSTILINYTDIMRVLSAILLLGNVSFVEGSKSEELDIEGSTELKSAAKLLGVASFTLYQSLTFKTTKIGKQLHKSSCSVHEANLRRHHLAQSLYSRLLQHMLNKVNSTLRPDLSTSLSGNDVPFSTYFPRELSRHPSSAQLSPTLHVMDCLSFKCNQGTHLERLCSNIAAEAMQHFYNTQIFHSLQDGIERDEITNLNEMQWFDNSSVIQLLSEQNVGLISIIHLERKLDNPSRKCMMKNLIQLHGNSECMEINKSQAAFTINHYNGRVSYDCNSLLTESDNSLSDDIISLFKSQETNLPLLTDLYAKELKDLEANGGQPRGVTYRLSPCQVKTYETRSSTHGQDFLYGIDSIMQILASSNPHFIRCIKASPTHSANHWDDDFVRQQLNLLEVPETVKMMSNGLSHQLTYPTFIDRYFCMACHKTRKTMDHHTIVEEIMDKFVSTMEARDIPYDSMLWELGKKYIFLNEKALRGLDLIKVQTRKEAAVKIQAVFRGWILRECWPIIVKQLRETLRKTTHHTKRNTSTSRRHAHDSGYNTPAPISDDISLGVQGHCRNGSNELTDGFSSAGKPQLKSIPAGEALDLSQEVKAPTLPPRRQYSVHKGLKIYFPQRRIIKETINVEGYILPAGQEVICLGYSSRSSYISVAFHNDILDIPFHQTSIKTPSSTAASDSQCSDHTYEDVKFVKLKPWELSPNRVYTTEL